MQKVIKRNGKKVKFEPTKISNAVEKAFIEVDNELTSYGKRKAIEIATDISKIGKTMTVEEIQDLVEDKLMASKRKDVARAYITYRYKKNVIRESNTTDKSILEIIDSENEYYCGENSNKNPRLNTTIRDYMAGETSVDISRRLLLDKDIIEAHDEGIIHFHDMDYYAQHMHNCFNKNTRFITDEGVKAFKDFKDGESVRVLDKDGNWRDATVRYYGKQAMQKVTLKSIRCEKKIICTENHRWILNTGEVTTHLEEGMTLYPLQNDNDNLWKVEKIEPNYGCIEYDAWCVEEPITHSFTLEGDIVTGNCGLVNLIDMLENTTVISEIMIDKPHCVSTAATITTQVIAQVSSSQFGGQSISLAHLAPFVDITRQALIEQVTKERIENGDDLDKNKIMRTVNRRLNKEIEDAIQTIQYQIVTLMTTNGQAPFITLFVYFNEARNEREKEDLVLLTKELLKQTKLGVKNQEGVYVTPAFPKIIYVLEEDNTYPGSKYYDVTRLAAECSIERLTPDYVSEKKMKELKEGQCFAIMGCRSNLSPWKDENGKYKFYGRLTA